MKFVISTAVVALVVTFLAPGIAEAQKKDCAKIRQECRAAYGGFGGYRQNDRNSGATFSRVRECIASKGC
jgi:hypothetical protein